MANYYANLTVTGKKGEPQNVLFSSLADLKTGVALPSFSIIPMVEPSLSIPAVNIYERTKTGFKIEMNDVGLITDSVATKILISDG